MKLEREDCLRDILKTPSCPISVNKLRVLDIRVLHGEDLGLLRGVLSMTKELQVLKVWHRHPSSESEVPKVADLKLTSVESLTIGMPDYDCYRSVSMICLCFDGGATF
ncbi:hypothetical protein F5146DRAFT_1135442 [Armillaria mellea]|nr:hypothetical protein F5146DRAFT_1135442 [Armillaria mellea]